MSMKVLLILFTVYICKIDKHICVRQQERIKTNKTIGDTNWVSAIFTRSFRLKSYPMLCR